MVSYDPRITKIDAERRWEVIWDVRLAARLHDTNTLQPKTGTYRWVTDLGDAIDCTEAKYEKLQRPVGVCLDLETVGLHPYYSHVWIVLLSVIHESGQALVYGVRWLKISNDKLRLTAMKLQSKRVAPFGSDENSSYLTNRYHINAVRSYLYPSRRKHMLELAIKAGLPLISVTTDDLVNVETVLAHYTGDIEQLVSSSLNDASLKAHAAWYMINPDADKLVGLYGRFAEVERPLIVVNLEEPSPVVFDAGPLKVPHTLLVDMLENIGVEEGESVEHMVAALGGLSIKEVAEVCRLCQARYESLTPQGVADLRRVYTRNARGLTLVDSHLPYYEVPEELEKWWSEDGCTFLSDKLPVELTPRGLLMNGPPGTGKTMAAKWLASKWGVPLFRLDLGAVMGKYVGESEANFQIAISRIDQCEPCVVLLDEAEKIFQSGEDAGVTQRLLSGLLWWLQEHQTRVFSVVTTNDMAALPPELYRPGRIDQTLYMRGLKSDELETFLIHQCQYYDWDPDTYVERVQQALQDGSQKTVEEMVKGHTGQPVYVSQAQAKQALFREVKKALIKQKDI